MGQTNSYITEHFWEDTLIYQLPSGNDCYIAIEHDHRNSGFSQLEHGGSVHSYVAVYQAGYV